MNSIYKRVISLFFVAVFFACAADVGATERLQRSLIPMSEPKSNETFPDFSTTFFPCAYNNNGRNVADELFWLSDSGLPITPEQQVLLTNVTQMPCCEVGYALDNMSGSQYASLCLSSELSTRRFARRLYDPVRTFLSLDPICDVEGGCCPQGITFWGEGGASFACFGNTHQSCGFKNRGYQVTFGAQMVENRDYLGGLAFTYEHTDTNFHIQGTGKTDTFLGAVYGAYRFCDFYLLGDGILGGSVNKVKRSFLVGPQHYFENGEPQSFQCMLSLELGKDFYCSKMLIQPFFGLEGGYYFYKHFKERGEDPLVLNFHRRYYGTFDTRIGVHLSSNELLSGLYVGVDLAWQYRCTQFNGFLDGRFVDAVDHELEEQQDQREEQVKETIKNNPMLKHRKNRQPQWHRHHQSQVFYRTSAMKLDPNSFTAALNLEQEFCDNWTIFVSGNWQQWQNACAYDALAGISFSW
jgi:hypothetical protein